MTEATFVQGDTSPFITSTLVLLGTTTPLPGLSTAAVRFQMRKENDKRFTVNQPADIVDASLGQVRYSWATNDLAVPGDYLVQWEVTFAGGRIQTQAEPNVITVRRQ